MYAAFLNQNYASANPLINVSKIVLLCIFAFDNG